MYIDYLILKHKYPLYLMKNSRFMLGGIKHQEKCRYLFKKFYPINQV